MFHVVLLGSSAATECFANDDEEEDERTWCGPRRRQTHWEQVFNILFSGDDVQHPHVVCFVIVN